MLTGFSRKQQIFYFFEQNKEQLYSTHFISQFICNNFDLSSKQIPKSGISMIQQIHNEVSSNISKLIDPKYNTRSNYNFERIQIGKDYFYSYKKNDKLKLPEIKTVNITNSYKTTKILKPMQTSFDFDEPEILIEENTAEDIEAKDFEESIVQNSDKHKYLNLNLFDKVSFFWNIVRKMIHNLCSKFVNYLDLKATGN